MHLEALAHGGSVLHRLDPRAKLVAAIILTLTVALGRGLLVELVSLGLGLVGTFCGRFPWREVCKRLVPVNGFAVFMCIMLPWKLGDTESLGLKLALDITLKANAIMLLLLGLIATSQMNHLFHALAHWHVPDKLIHLFLFFYRYLHVLHREYHRLSLAMKARGFTPRTNLHTYRSYAWLVGMLLVRSYDRSQRVYQAMLCRGFTGTYWLLDHFHWNSQDTIFLVVAFVTTLGLIVLAYIGS